MKISSLQREFKHYALAERGLQPRTLRDILAAVRRLTSWAGTEALDALSTTVVRAFLRHGRLEWGWAARTFHLNWQYLKTFFGWCVRAGYLKDNPVSPIEKPRLPQRLPRCLSQAEAKKVLYAAGSSPWRSELQRSRSEAIVATFLMTGIRRAELLSLRVGDLDWTQRSEIDPPNAQKLTLLKVLRGTPLHPDSLAVPDPRVKGSLAALAAARP